MFFEEPSQQAVLRNVVFLFCTIEKLLVGGVLVLGATYTVLSVDDVFLTLSRLDLRLTFIKALNVFAVLKKNNTHGM